MVISPKGTWLDRKCKAKLDFVCEKPETKKEDESPAAIEEEVEEDKDDTSPEENVPEVPVTCKKGWHVVDDSCYLIGPKKRSHKGAKAFCERQGATLAMIGNEAENQAVSALLGKK